MTNTIEAAKTWMLEQAKEQRTLARRHREEAATAQAISDRDPDWKFMAEQPGRHRAKADLRELVADGLDALIADYAVQTELARALAAELKRHTEHLADFDSRHSMESSSDVAAALYCAQQLLANS